MTTPQVAHNHYVLAVEMFSETQERAYTATLPALLSGLQVVQQHHVRDFQAGMVQFHEAVDHSAQPYRDMHQAAMDVVNKLDGAAEYVLLPPRIVTFLASFCSRKGICFVVRSNWHHQRCRTQRAPPPVARTHGVQTLFKHSVLAHHRFPGSYFCTHICAHTHNSIATSTAADFCLLPFFPQVHHFP